MALRHLGTAVLTAAVTLMGACGPATTDQGSRPPVLPTVDFTPKLRIMVAGDGLVFEAGPPADPRVRTDPPTVPSGSVIEIRNDAPEDRRLRAGPGVGDGFDTGTMRPGERTVAVVANDTGTTRTLPLVDVVTNTPRGNLIVDPA